MFLISAKLTKNTGRSQETPELKQTKMTVMQLQVHGRKAGGKNGEQQRHSLL